MPYRGADIRPESKLPYRRSRRSEMFLGRKIRMKLEKTSWFRFQVDFHSSRKFNCWISCCVKDTYQATKYFEKRVNPWKSSIFTLWLQNATLTSDLSRQMKCKLLSWWIMISVASEFLSNKKNLLFVMRPYFREKLWQNRSL